MFSGKTETENSNNNCYGDSYLKGGNHDHTYKDNGYSDIYRESISD